MGIENLVTKGADGNEVPTGTPTSPASVPQGGTTGTNPSDADFDAKWKTASAELERKFKAETEKHVGRVKSQLDRERDAWNKREAELSKQLQAVRMQTMDEPSKKKFQEEMYNDELKRRDQEIANMKAQFEERQAAQQYLEFFNEFGVTVDRSESLEELVQNGYAALRAKFTSMTEELNALRTAKPQEPQKAKGEEAPDVVTQTRQASTGAGWPELIKKYGTMQRVYELVESGQLDPKIIPLG